MSDENEKTSAKTKSKPPDDSARVIRLRMRADLQIVQQNWQGRQYWVIKDPIALKYFRFEAEELAILKMLDGEATADEVRERFEAEFAPQRLTTAEFYQLLAMFHRSSLVVSDSIGQGSKLLERHNESVQRERKQVLTNPLAIRFRGVDPDRFLSWLNGLAGWIFSWPVLAVAAVLGIGALGLVFTNFDMLLARMPAFEEFFAGSNWIWLSLVVIVTKIIHELGHGVACKKFGGECNEMGMMFLVMMPCLYCNVSDSWMLPDKWKRAAIAAAGMYIELVLAALATFVWWYSEPGLINQLALNVMTVCSVSTLLFNANPLMKYDGYYILCDIAEIPNLRQKASAMLHQWAGKWFLGLDGRDDPFQPNQHRWMFTTYAIAAVVYRWLITFSIFWFLYRLLEPAGLKVIGQFLALTAIWGLFGMPIVQLVRFIKVPGRWMAVDRIRLATVTVLGVVLLGGVLLFPVPHRVRCSFFVQPEQTGNVFVSAAGFVKEMLVQSGDAVEANQTLVQLDSPDLELKMERLLGELDIAIETFKHVQQSATYDVENQMELQMARARYDSAVRRVEQQKNEMERLSIRAPCKGFFVADTRRPKPDAKVSGRLPSWHGSPLDSCNIGAWLDSPTRIGRVVDGAFSTEVILAVDQGDIEFLKAGQSVELWVRQLPGKIFSSRTRQVSPARMLTAPPGLSARKGGDLVTTQDADGNDIPQNATWQVSVPLETDGQKIVSGATGVAHIRVGTQPLVSRIWRELCRTFRFEL